MPPGDDETTDADRDDGGDRDRGDGGGDGDRGGDADGADPVSYGSPGSSRTGGSSSSANGPDGGAPADRDEESDGSDGNGEDDGSDDEPSLGDVETVVVEPGDVLEGMTYNADPGPKIEDRYVFTLEPPFSETMRLEPEPLDVEPDPDVETAENRSTIDAGDSNHVRPFRFVEDGDGALRQYPSKQLAREELGEDADESDLEAWQEAAMDRWESYVLENLSDSLEVFTSHDVAFIDVEYEE